MGRMVMESDSLQQKPIFVGQDKQQQTLEKIIFAHELERRKWALDIHDGIIQSLANIHLRLQACKRLLSKDPEEAEKDLDNIEELVAEAIAEIRGIVDDLRPSILDDVGLVPAIEKYLRRIEKEDHLRVSFEVALPVSRLPYEIETVVYRIVQETLANVRKHARATKVKMKIVIRDNRLATTIADNGQGFDVEAVDIEGDNWGLIGMRERAEIVGGSLSIRSVLGKGTEIYLDVPISQQQERTL